MSSETPTPEFTPGASPTEPQARWVSAMLILLLLVTLAMRVWNGSAGLDAGRFFDERFSLRNVGMVLKDGTVRPDNAFYGSLSYLPQTAALWTSEKLYEITGNETFAIYNDRAGDGWSRTAYFIIRLVCAVFGTISVWLTFLLGRRLFDPYVGLLAATLFSAFPRHILASTEFKPDILVVLLVVLTFLWSLDVVEKPTTKAFLWAGAGVGLAVATKYTGVGVAIPLTVGVLYGGWRQRRTWMWLIGAGVASIITFALLNIHLAVIIEYLPRIWRIMESKGDATGGSRWDVLAIEFEFLVRHHRWPLMGFVLAGCALMFRRAFDRGGDFMTRVSALMVLSYIFGYSALYAAATKLFKGQNYLPVAAFTSVLGAWTLLIVWRWLIGRLTWLRAWPVATVLWGAFLVYLFAFPFDIVYRDVVPSTQRQAEQMLRQKLRPLDLRHVFYEPLERPLVASTPGGHWLVTLPVDPLSNDVPHALDDSDAELFPAARLEGEGAPFYLQRATRPGVRSVRFNPSWFKAHGPPLVLLLHPWKLDGEPLELALERETDGVNQYRAAEQRRSGQTLSLSIWLPLDTGWTQKDGKNIRIRPQMVTVDGQKMPLYRTRRGGSRAHYVTPRFVLDPPVQAVSEGQDSQSPDVPSTDAEPAVGDLVLTFDNELQMAKMPEARLVRWVDRNQ